MVASSTIRRLYSKILVEAYNKVLAISKEQELMISDVEKIVKSVLNDNLKYYNQLISDDNIKIKDDLDSLDKDVYAYYGCRKPNIKKTLETFSINVSKKFPDNIFSSSIEKALSKDAKSCFVFACDSKISKLINRVNFGGVKRRGDMLKFLTDDTLILIDFEIDSLSYDDKIELRDFLFRKKIDTIARIHELNGRDKQKLTYKKTVDACDRWITQLELSKEQSQN